MERNKPNVAASTSEKGENALDWFIVDESANGDNSVVELSKQTLEALKLLCGDTVRLLGNGKETVCVVVSDERCPTDKMRMNYVIRRNVNVGLGDVVCLQPLANVALAKKVHIVPMADSLEDHDDGLFEAFLKPYFLERNRPIHTGDLLTVRGRSRVLDFKIVDTEPSPFCMVIPSSTVILVGDAEFDFSWTVNIEPGKPPLRLSCNRGDDPLRVAKNFLYENHLQQVYLEPVMKLMMSNAWSPSAAAELDHDLRMPTCVETLRQHIIDEYMKDPFVQLNVVQARESLSKISLDDISITLQLVDQSDATSGDEVAGVGSRSVQDHRSGKAMLSASTAAMSFLFQTKHHRDITQMIVVGDPGQGKTTFVQKLAYDWALAQKNVNSSNIMFGEVALLLVSPLRALKESTTTIIDIALKSKHLPEWLATKADAIKSWICENPSRILLVFDGYDELSAACPELDNLLCGQQPSNYARIPFVITSRPYAIAKSSSASLYYKIAAFTTNEVGNLVRQYGVTYPKSVMQRVAAFCESEQNSFLASSPLLLQLLCWICVGGRAHNDEMTEVELPASRTAIYFMVALSLANRFDRSLLSKTQLDPSAAKAWGESKNVHLLSAFAYKKTYARGGRSELVFDRNELDEFCGRGVANELLEAGYIVADDKLSAPASADNVQLSFLHKTFQEFFAAVHLVRQLEAFEDVKKGHFSFNLRRGFERKKEKMQKLFFEAKQYIDVLLFAMGVVWETRSCIAEKLLELLGESFVSALDAASINAKHVHDARYYDFDRAHRLIAFGTSLFREANEDGKKSLRQWAQSKEASFDQFTVGWLLNTDLNSTKSPVAELLKLLQPFGVGLWVLQALTAHGRNFVFSNVAHKWRCLCACEFTNTVAHVQDYVVREETQSMRSDVFRFCGTSAGILELLSSITVSSHKAMLNILKEPIKHTESVTRKESNLRASVDAPTVKGHYFGKIWLMLATRLDANDVKRVIELLSTNACKDADISIYFVDEPIDEKSENLQPLPINQGRFHSVFVGHVKKVYAWGSAIPSLSAFETLLSAVGRIDQLHINRTSLQLIDEFRQHSCSNLAVVRRVCYSAWDSKLPSILNRFLSNVGASSVEVHFHSSHLVTNGSFDSFCSTIAALSSAGTLTDVLLDWKAARRKASPTEIGQALIELLRSSKGLRLELGGKLIDNISAMPDDLRSRVKCRAPDISE